MLTDSGKTVYGFVMFKVLMVSVLLGVIALWGTLTTPTVRYYAEGIEDKIIEQSIAKWGIRPQKSLNPFFADVTFKTQTLEGLWGQQQRGTIIINNTIQFVNKDLEVLLAHEFGHYLFLSHDLNSCSIMNDKIPLNLRTVTEDNKRDASFLNFRLMLCKFGSKLNWIFSSVDFN